MGTWPSENMRCHQNLGHPLLNVSRRRSYFRSCVCHAAFWIEQKNGPKNSAVHDPRMTLYMAISGGIDWKDCVQPLHVVSSVMEYMYLGQRMELELSCRGDVMELRDAERCCGIRSSS